MIGVDLYNKARSATMGINGGHDYEIKAYENLANAIIVKAVRDYQHALIQLHFNPYNSEAESRIKEVEHFVHSSYYRILTSVDGDYLLKEAKKQVEERGWKRFFVGYDD